MMFRLAGQAIGKVGNLPFKNLILNLADSSGETADTVYNTL